MLSLEEIYRNTVTDELLALERINAVATDEIQLKSDKEMLWYYNQKFALHALFIEGDLSKAKEHFYICARLDEYLVKQYGSRILDSGISNITYAILCDNKNMIDRYADLGHEDYMWMVEHGHSTLIYCIQQVIKKDWEKVLWSVGIMKTKNTKLQKVIQPDILFFEGLLEKAEDKMVDAIQQLINDHKKRNKQMGISQIYISIPALTYTKLAWLNDFEIQIENPLVPKALLPFRPLKKYDDKYDFFKPI